jgi:hypothetical protein
VVEGLTRVAGAIDVVKKIARKEVAKAAAALGMEHFFAGPPAGGGDRMTDVGDRMTEDEATFPGRTAARSAAVQTRGPGAASVDPGSAPHRSASLHAAAHPGNSGGTPDPGNSGLQIVADSVVHGGGREDG